MACVKVSSGTGLVGPSLYLLLTHQSMAKNDSDKKQVSAQITHILD